MDFVKEKEVIEEIEYGNNFGYILADSSYFIPTDYKILVSQTNGVFVRCMKTMYNGKIQLYYVTDEYQPMSSVLMQVTPERLVTILTNLIADVLQVQNNGFLNCINIDLLWNKIFVENSTLKVKLVYVPVNKREIDNYAVFETELRSGIVRMIQVLRNNTNARLQALTADLTNQALSLQDVYNHVVAANIVTEENDTGKKDTADTEVYLRLRALNAPYHFEIPVKRTTTLIGKKQGQVDACIPYNDKISRKHCVIKVENGECLLADQGSKNGTYVNNKRLLPGNWVPLHRNDEVRLADSRFCVDMD